MTYQEFVEKWNKESLASYQIMAKVVNEEDVHTIKFYHAGSDKLMMELTWHDYPNGTRSKSLKIKDKDKDNFLFSSSQLRLLGELLMSSGDLGVSNKKYWFPVYSKDSIAGFVIPSYYKIDFSSDFDDVEFYTEDVLELIKSTFEKWEWDNLMKFKQVYIPDEYKKKDSNTHE